MVNCTFVEQFKPWGPEPHKPKGQVLCPNKHICTYAFPPHLFQTHNPLLIHFLLIWDYLVMIKCTHGYDHKEYIMYFTEMHTIIFHTFLIGGSPLLSRFYRQKWKRCDWKSSSLQSHVMKRGGTLIFNFFFEDYIYVTSWHFMGLSNILSGDNDVYQTLYKKRKTQAVSHSQLSIFIEKMCS